MTETSIELQVCCFYCGGNQNLQPTYFGYNNIQFAKFIALEPCVYCRHLFDQGVVIFETTTVPNCEAPKVADDIWLTGRWVIVRPNQLNLIVGDENTKRILKTGLAFVTAKHYKQLGMADRVEVHH